MIKGTRLKYAETIVGTGAFNAIVPIIQGQNGRGIPWIS
jgi:hypothetical protein